MLDWDDFKKNYDLITYYAQLGAMTLTRTQAVVTNAQIWVFNILENIKNFKWNCLHILMLFSMYWYIYFKSLKSLKHCI